MSKIYGLEGSDGIRYVGQTARHEAVRLTQHICDAEDRPDIPRMRWILEQHRAGTLRIVVLREVDRDDADPAEREVIADFRAKGFDLFNVFPGGRGRRTAGWSERDSQLRVRLAVPERSSLERAVQLSGLTLSEYVRMELRASIERRLAAAGEKPEWTLRS